MFCLHILNLMHNPNKFFPNNEYVLFALLYD